jgi:hypothetical protein
MNNQKRVCLFCGGTPLTKEHNPPQWVRNCFPDCEGSGLWVLYPDGKQQSRGTHRSVTPVVLRGICEPCNSGWMSRIEETTRPILEPMIKGVGCTLHRTDQETLAVWLTKTALVSAPLFTWDYPPRFKEAYRAFYQTRVPNPEYYRILISTHGGDSFTNGLTFLPFGLRLEDPALSPIAEPDIFYFTIFMGHFIGMVIYRHPDLIRDVPASPALMRKIFPFEASTIWPFGRFLTTEMVLGLSRGPQNVLREDPR